MSVIVDSPLKTVRHVTHNSFGIFLHIFFFKIGRNKTQGRLDLSEKLNNQTFGGECEVFRSVSEPPQD